MSKIVFHGDSVTYGVRAGVTQADTFAQKVGTARCFTDIINTGVPGNTSAQGLARFQADVLSQTPDAVCIMFGINDVWTSLPGSGQTPITAQQYHDNLTQMVIQAKAANIRPTLLTPNLVRSSPYIAAFPAYLDACRNVAYEEGIPLVDCYLLFEDVYFLDDTATFDALWVDYQHPSPTGHTLIANLVGQSYNAKACS